MELLPAQGESWEVLERRRFGSAGRREFAGHLEPDTKTIAVLVQQLPVNQTEGEQNSPQQEQIKNLDAKIRQWSKGKEGNIRSLLSTLQLVLWAESGWKQVPLVNIIEGPSVKKAYQKALLCLHPDKLQQKGASSNQKYIAEKVFDILQEAWDHFNSISEF